MATKTTEQFIKQARIIHGNKYNYSNVNYINAHKKIIIICPEHGPFEQFPTNHLSGNKCQKCSNIHRPTTEEFIQKAKEVHGIQHYEYIPFLHRYNEDNFLKQKNRDDAVRYNARRWKYKYLEFNYKQFEHMTKEQFEQLIINNVNKLTKLRIKS